MFNNMIIKGFLIINLIAGSVSMVYAQTNPVYYTPPVKITDTKDVGRTVITQDDINRNNPENIVDLFRDTTAVTITGGGTANNKIFIHGLDQTNINVTVDGASVGAYGWHHASNSNIDATFLKSVTVDVGVAPADSGFGSVAGAVKFITKDARDLLRHGTSIGAMFYNNYSTENKGLRTTFAAYGVYEGFDVLTMYTKHHNNDWTNGDGKVQKGTRNDLNRGLLKLTYESPDGHKFAISGEYSEDKAKRQFKANMYDTNPGKKNAYRGMSIINANQKRTTVSIRYANTNPTDFIDPEAEVYFNDMRQVWGQTADMHIVKTGGKMQNRFAVGNGNLTTGVDFYNLDIKARDKEGVLEKSFGGGLYAQLRISPFERFKISTGIRNDYQSFDSVDKQRFENDGLSPNISLEFAATEWIDIFGGANHVWGGVNSVEHALLSNKTVYKDIKSTTSDNYRAGLRLHNEYVTFEGSYFSTLIKNPIYYSGGENTRFSGKDLKTTGYDVSIAGKYEGFRAGVNYTYADVKYGDKKSGTNLFYVSSPVGHLVATNASYYAEGIDLTVGMSSEHGFKIDEKPDFYVDSYNVYNCFISYTPEIYNFELDLRMDVKNLTDTNYYTRATYSGSLTNALIKPVYEQGRTFVLTAGVKF